MFFLTIEFSVETLKNSAFVALIPIAILLIRFLWEVIGVVIDKLMKKDERRLIQSLDVELFESRERFYECYMSAFTCVNWWLSIGSDASDDEKAAWRFQFEGEEQVARLKQMIHEIKVRRKTVEYTFCGCTEAFSKITRLFSDTLEAVAYYISKLYFYHHENPKTLAYKLYELRVVKRDDSNNEQKALFEYLMRVMNEYRAFVERHGKPFALDDGAYFNQCQEDGIIQTGELLRCLRKRYDYLIKAYWQTIYSKGSLVLLNKKGFVSNSDDGLD